MVEASDLRQLITISVVEPQLGGVNIDTGVAVRTEKFKRGIFLEPM